MTEPTSIPDDPALLKPMVLELTDQLKKSQRREELLQAKLEELARKLFGRKSEKIDPNQLSLVDLGVFGIKTPEEAEPKAEAEEPPVKARRRPKRKRPSKALPRRRVEFHLPEEDRGCSCCDDVMPAIKEIVHEQLEYTPASLEVIENVTFLYGCKNGCDEKIVSSSKPPQMVEKGLAGPGLLAHVITSKYCDHVPLNRLHGILKRQHKAEIPQATLGGWVKNAGHGVIPLIEYLKEDQLRSAVIATDDTSVPVQKKGGTYRGRLWVYIGDTDHPLVIYDYTPTREKEGPAEFLKNFSGYLQADAYTGYDQLFDPERDLKIHEVGCWMHCRRYFFEASQKDKGLPLVALAMIRELYRYERIAADYSPQQRYELRQEKSVPILDAMGEWVEENRLTVPPKGLVGKALTYTHNQWEALRRYTTEGYLEIDNGRSERMMRLIAIGRKNWLFAGNDEGGRRAANHYTLIGTCRYHGWDPYEYLRRLYTCLPGLPESRLHEVTPLAWAAEKGLKSNLLKS